MVSNCPMARGSSDTLAWVLRPCMCVRENERMHKRKTCYNTTRTLATFTSVFRCKK